MGGIKIRINVSKCIKIISLVFLIIIISNNVFAASSPTLVNKLNTALKRILSYLEKLATLKIDVYKNIPCSGNSNG